MTIPVQQFQILSPEQANPLGQGMLTGAEIYRNFVTNKYLPQQLQQQARQRELANQTSELNLKDLPDYLKARLSGMNLANQTSQTNLQYLPQKSRLGIEGQILGNQGKSISNQTNQLKLSDLPRDLQVKYLQNILANQGQSLSNDQMQINNASLPARNQAGLENTQLGNQKLSTENQYLVPKLQQQAKEREINNAIASINLKYSEPNAQANLQNIQLGNQKQNIENQNLPLQQQQEAQAREIANAIAAVNMKYAEPNAQQDLRNKSITQEQKQQMAINSASQIDTIKQNNRDYQKELNTASVDADTNKRLEKAVDQLDSAYKNLTPRQRGPVYGHLPALSSESQIADNAANNLQAIMAKIVQAGGRPTNFLTKFAGTLKPNRAMSPEALQQLSEGFRANSRREQERPGFLLAAREKGIDAQTAKNLWNQYDEQNPVYDFNKRQVNKYKDKSYMDYLSDKAVNAVK
jgi:hypothetical protein